MNPRPTPISSRHTPAFPDDLAVARACRELVAQFRDELAEAEIEANELPYELLERAVDGQLSTGEKAEFDRRLALDSGLRREFDELVELRIQLVGRPRRPARTAQKIVGWVAAAALLAAVGTHWLLNPASGRIGVANVSVQDSSATPPAPTAPEVVFHDDFESGNASNWSN